MDQMLTTPPTHADLAEALRTRARSEWLEWSTLVAMADAATARIEASDVSGPRKQVELSFVATDLAHTAHWSEGQVSNRLSQARRVRDNTPGVWAAFADGSLDAAKVREIAGAVDRLQRPGSIARLDARVVGYAARHTVAEVRRWLKLFVARVESDLFTERAERASEDRGVDVFHGDDGMSWLTLYDQSHRIAAIDKRLSKEATALGADDGRTLHQRRADLAAAWLTTSESGEAAVNADIAVVLPASALAGATEAPAESADGAWVVPAGWITDLAEHAGTSIFWHRMALDPITDDVLAHEYKGRFAPAVLAKALEFRDGVCQAPGCCKPASQCDIDHRIPHE